MQQPQGSRQTICDVWLPSGELLDVLDRCPQSSQAMLLILTTGYPPGSLSLRLRDNASSRLSSTTLDLCCQATPRFGKNKRMIKQSHRVLGPRELMAMGMIVYAHPAIHTRPILRSRPAATYQDFGLGYWPVLHGQSTSKWSTISLVAVKLRLAGRWRYPVPRTIVAFCKK